MAGQARAADEDRTDPSTKVHGRRGSELKKPGYEIFIAALSILSIVNLVLINVIQYEDLETVLFVMNGVLSLILFLDFCSRLWTAQSRSTYFFRSFGWADLLASVPLPQLKILRIFRLGRVYRLLRESGAKKIVRSLLTERAGSTLLLLLFVAILVLQFGSLWMLRLEASSPDANITTGSDAIWYVIVTISTVGYGDQYPVTNAGRLLGAVIIVLGVGIFGTLTGYLANAFLSPHGATRENGVDRSSTADPVDAVGDRLARLTLARELRDSGVLTQGEFEATKAEILAG